MASRCVALLVQMNRESIGPIASRVMIVPQIHCVRPRDNSLVIVPLLAIFMTQQWRATRTNDRYPPTATTPIRSASAPTMALLLHHRPRMEPACPIWSARSKTLRHEWQR